MTKDDILTAAREAGFDNASGIYYGELERFAALVAAHVTEALTKSHEAAFQSYVDQAKADRELGALAARLDEREACLACYSPDDTATDWADKIRGRNIDSVDVSPKRVEKIAESIHECDSVQNHRYAGTFSV